jgi:hypothetical protein
MRRKTAATRKVARFSFQDCGEPRSSSMNESTDVAGDSPTGDAQRAHDAAVHQKAESAAADSDVYHDATHPP